MSEREDPYRQADYHKGQSIKWNDKPSDPVMRELKALRKYIDTGFAFLWLALTILLLAIVASCVMNS